MPKAIWPLRIWGIRHIRAMVLCYRINRHYDLWRSAGFIGGWSADEIAYWKDIKDGRA